MLDSRARVYEKKIEKQEKLKKKYRKRKVEKTYGLPSRSFFYVYVIS
jgi:hypothetical protein